MNEIKSIIATINTINFQGKGIKNIINVIIAITVEIERRITDRPSCSAIPHLVARILYRFLYFLVKLLPKRFVRKGKKVLLSIEILRAFLRIANLQKEHM